MTPYRCVYCARVQLQADLLGPARSGGCPARGIALSDAFKVILCHRFEPVSGSDVVKRFSSRSKR